jgi:murein DD-endopeptidase MepM/ murein hydrolase activator NlpD
MRHDVNGEACPICGEIPYDSDRRVLVQGKERSSYCSQACLRIGVRSVQIAKRKARLRRYAVLFVVVLAAVGVGYVRWRFILLQRRPAPVPVAAPAPIVPVPEAPEPTPFGPRWPPTDDDWLEQFAHTAWVYPLPGPMRHRPAIAGELLVADAAEFARARARTAGHWGVDLGGELWGEHVYATHDGVIDRLRRSEDAPGGVYVRIAHWSGAVFTQYFHLAAVPTRLAVGMRVSAGDVIGLIGDSGPGDTRAHLHFELSVRPASSLPEVYWDPQPLMAQWPLHTPERGSVAGLVSADAPAERVAGAPLEHHHLLPPRVKSRRSADTTVSD